MDADDNPTVVDGEECGAEAHWYEEEYEDSKVEDEFKRYPRNGPLPDIRELSYIRGFREFPVVLTGGVLNPEDDPKDQIRVRGIADMFNTLGSAKVYVNDCTRDELMTVPGIFDEEDEEDLEKSSENIDAILNAKKEEPDYDVDETQSWWQYKDFNDLLRDNNRMRIDGDDARREGEGVSQGQGCQVRRMGGGSRRRQKGVQVKLIDGKQLAQNLRGEIAAGVERLKAEKGVTPGLAVILVGDNPASVSYVTAKEKACAEAGMLSREIRLPAETTEADLVALVGELNDDPAIHGILVQLPVPKHISDKAVIDAIAPEKDVDGFTPVNVGRMMIGERCFLPCTPHGIIKLIEFSGMDVRGRHAVVIGRSNIVGKPVAALLSRKETNATVTLCHTGTPDVGKFTREADVVVVAAGRPNTLTGDMLKPGAVVIDVGVNRVPDATKPKGFRLVGDADFESCAKVAGAITPVPGGVGPMTITMLLWNTLESARRFAG